ncbi:MAG: DUF4430 domain-containing protein [Clostridiales bacterium]|nr:DUF4430 domain-containing protein [Clostridiales bacterium]
MKQKIASALIVMMLLSQCNMGFSFAGSNQESEAASKSDIITMENTEKIDAASGDTGETRQPEQAAMESGDTKKIEQPEQAATESEEIQKNKPEKTGISDEEKAEQPERTEPEETMQLEQDVQLVQPILEEEEQTSWETQLEKVTEYYRILGQDAELSAPMEGVARFAVGERASEKALGTVSEMETKYHLYMKNIEEVGFDINDTSDILASKTDGVNAQTWLGQIVLDILAVGGDPADFYGRNYIHELLASQFEETGFFVTDKTSGDKYPKAGDGLAILALNAYWEEDWPDYGENKGKDVYIAKAAVATAKSAAGTANNKEKNFFKGAEWGIKSTDTQLISFYNNFWLMQGFATAASTADIEKSNGFLLNGIKTLKPTTEFAYKTQCEMMAAYIISKLSTGEVVTSEEWQALAVFQMEDGQYKRKQTDTSANGEATALAAIALDYGKRAESSEETDKRCAFLRLADANPEADHSSVKTSEETIFSEAADVNTAIDAVAGAEELLGILKNAGNNVSFLSSNKDIISSENKTFTPLEAGEPDEAVQLKVIVCDGSKAVLLRSKVFTVEPADKTFPMERNVNLLKQYYYTNYADGIFLSNQAFSLAALMNDPQLGGIPYNTQFYGTGGYYEDRTLFSDPEVSAILDYVAMNKDPRQYEKLNPNTGLTEDTDLIQELLNRQYSNGSFSRPELGYQYAGCVLPTLALETYFGGAAWGNEAENTAYGRIGTIEDILSHMIDVQNSKAGQKNLSIISEASGGRVFGDITGNITSKDMRYQSLAVLLFSRWLNDETPVTVNGETKPLKEYALQEVDGMLKSLKWLSDNAKTIIQNDYPLTEQSYYISALIAGGQRDKVIEYGLWDKLRNGRAKNGSWYDGGTSVSETATATMAMAIGDYQNEKAILSTMTYDMNALSDEEAIEKDIKNIILPSSAMNKLMLPISGYYGSSIVWTSSNEGVINPNTGEVNRPEKGQMDAVVSLIATVKRGEASETKTYIIKVPAIADETSTKGTADYEALSVPLFVVEDISLPTTGENGSTIAWQSSDPAVIAADGKVTPDVTEDKRVILTATVVNGDYSKEKEFPVTVSRILTENVVGKAMAQLRAYYNDQRNLTNSYWDIFAAKSVLGDDFKNYNFNVYDVKSHRKASNWQGTDYGAVVLQILAQGDNPYNYQGENYVEKLQNFVDKGWGAWGSPIWAAMALDAAGADPSGHKYNRQSTEGFFKSQLKDLKYGPDLAGWSLIPMATTMMRNGDAQVTGDLTDFIAALKASQEKSGANKGLFNTGGVEGGLLTLSNGCVVSGFMAMQKTGIPGFDLTQDEWKKGGVGVLDVLYSQEIKEMNSFNNQIVLEFGDVYYGDSVWRRVGVKPEQLDELIQKSEQFVENGEGKYTAKSFDALKTAYETALTVQSNNEKMRNYYFGQSYFSLRDAVDSLKEKGTAEITIYGRAESGKILENVSVRKSGNLLDVLQEAVLENGISMTAGDKGIQELGGIKADSKGKWYAYKQTEAGDGVRIEEPFQQYKVEEGTSLIFKYCEDTSKLSADMTLNQHLVYDSAHNLKIGGEIDSNNEVTGDLILPVQGFFGTSISWLPNKLFAINENGKVTRDAKEDINVVLTAKIYLNGISAERQFNVKVKSLNGDSPTTPTTKKAYISIAGPVGESWKGKYSKTAIEIESGETAFSLLEKTGVKLTADKNTKYGVYVRGINGLSEFDKGNQSGWMYRVNGEFPGHSAALERVYENDYVEWLYTRDLGRDIGGYVPGVENGSGSVGRTQKNANNVAVTTTVTASLNDTTKEAKAVLKPDDITKALKELQEKVKSVQKDGKENVVPELRIDVTSDNKAESVETIIPKASVATFGNDAVQAITFITVLGEVTFDKEIIKALTKDIAGDLSVIIAKTEAGSAIAKISAATNEVKAKIEGRPVYEFNMQNGSQTVSELGGTATVIVPYNLGVGEQAESVVAYWLKPDGKLEIIKNGYMTDDNKHFIMENNHWSTYVIGYNEAKFADTTSHWAKSNILYLAARDIIKGKSSEFFAPNSQITRAEFVQILANMSGDDLSKYTKSSFDDVSEKVWYAKAVEWAVKNGIAGGTGNDKFSPNANITRQDMSVMISKYVENVEKKTLPDVNKAVKFADNSEIASYAKDSVTAMQKAGIINGVKNNLGSYSFNPRANATRAEATTMIANYIKQQ